MATTKDRSTALRIRRLGSKASDSQKDWLKKYEAGRTRQTPARVNSWPIPENKPNGQTAPIDPPTPEVPPPESAPAPAPAPAPALTPAPAEHRRIEPFIDSAPAPLKSTAIVTTPSGQKCTIKNCPACAGEMKGGEICLATGKRVWHPMQIESARGQAKFWLWLIGMGIKLFRSDKQYITPTPEEIESFAKAIQLMAFRRANWLSAIDDIVMVLMSAGGYSARAFNAPTKAEQRAMEAEARAKEASNAS